MVKRILYTITVLLTAPILLLQVNAQQPSIYEVRRLSINSSVFNEISPVIMKEGILFCSDRRFSVVKDRTSFTGNRIYNIYLAVKKDSANWSKPEELKSERSDLFNSGPLCFAPDGNTVYFTSEIETGSAASKKSFKNHSGIFISSFDGKNLGSLRPFKYNNPQFSIAQPSISRDGKYLYFASDMPGGYGGSDLYFCEFINGEWGNPVNMGPVVNSAGVENYPFMHPSGKLYFTSNRSGGIGGLDVYSTFLYNGAWEDPVLLAEPINSASDDFAFVAEEDQQIGYFSSNRDRTDDVFSFESTIIRKSVCDTLVENSFCFRFLEENAIKYDSIPFRYEWKFGDGSKAIGAMVEHCYKGPGTYLVQLDVVNLITNEILYNEKTDTLVLTEIEQPYITSVDRSNTGQSIKLNADSTNLPGWKIGTYYWNFGDETVAVGKEVDKTYFKPGTYNVQLIVSTEPEPGGMVREACISKNIIVVRQP
jgi:hypothetical protein